MDRIRVQYGKIILLDYNENPLNEIQGRITSGNLSINGSAAVRRTINFSMLASAENSNLMNVNNEISLNKKIKVEIGYKEKNEITWFPCGIFIISTANITRGINGWTIAVTAKDKMVTLDGTCGGMLDASVTFSESYIYADPVTRQQWTERKYVLIYDMIQEAVHHYGNVPLDKIIISDVPKYTKLLVKYAGTSPIYFSKDYSSFTFVKDENKKEFVNGQNIGYKRTEFTYPGTLTLNAGETVVALLNKICDVLGNFEFYFDLNGNFIFQEKKNYLNTASPLYELTSEDYVKQYSNLKYKYSLTDLESVSSLAINPKYENIKNDFIVWGEHKSADGTSYPIWYHLAIDKKPELNKALQYMYQTTDDKGNIIFKFSKQTNNSLGTLIRTPCNEWREELYREALVANSEGRIASIYDREILAYWNDLYTKNNENEMVWTDTVESNPESLKYWLDFIDTGSEMGKYSISTIGRRTKVVTDNKIGLLYSNLVPDVVFLSEDEYDNEEIRNEYRTSSQNVFRLTKNYEDLFVASSTGSSAFDKIRELLYQYLNYNAQITIQAFPLYYLEPNNILYIEDKKSNIIGNYVITQISLPLTYNGNMSIVATEALSRV